MTGQPNGSNPGNAGGLHANGFGPHLPVFPPNAFRDTSDMKGMQRRR